MNEHLARQIVEFRDGLDSSHKGNSKYKDYPAMTVEKCIWSVLLDLDLRYVDSIDPKYNRIGNYSIQETPYPDIINLAQSYRHADDFPCRSNLVFNLAKHIVLVAEFIEWAEHVGLPVLGEALDPSVNDEAPVRAVESADALDDSQPDAATIIANDLYERLADSLGIDVTKAGGGTIFSYLATASLSPMDAGKRYDLRNNDPYDGQSKDVGKRIYGSLVIAHNFDGKLQYVSIRKVIDAFNLRKKRKNQT